MSWMTSEKRNEVIPLSDEEIALDASSEGTLSPGGPRPWVLYVDRMEEKDALFVLTLETADTLLITLMLDTHRMIELIRPTEKGDSCLFVLVGWVIRPDLNCSECKENKYCYDVDGGGTMALRGVESLHKLRSLVKADIEKGESKYISGDDIEIGDLSVEDLSWLMTQNLQGEEVVNNSYAKRYVLCTYFINSQSYFEAIAAACLQLHIADKGTKQKKPREVGYEKRGKKIKKYVTILGSILGVVAYNIFALICGDRACKVAEHIDVFNMFKHGVDPEVEALKAEIVKLRKGQGEGRERLRLAKAELIGGFANAIMGCDGVSHIAWYLDSLLKLIFESQREMSGYRKTKRKIFKVRVDQKLTCSDSAELESCRDEKDAPLLNSVPQQVIVGKLAGKGDKQDALYAGANKMPVFPGYDNVPMWNIITSSAKRNLGSRLTESGTDTRPNSSYKRQNVRDHSGYENASISNSGPSYNIDPSTPSGGASGHRARHTASMETFINAIINACQELINAVANTLEAKEASGGQVTPATDAGLANLKQRWNYFESPMIKLRSLKLISAPTLLLPLMLGFMKILLNRRAGISAKIEAPVNFLTDPLDGRSTLRPADVLIFGWVGGKHACVDLTGVSSIGNYASEEMDNSYNGHEAISYVPDESVVLQRNINDTAREEWRSRANEGRRSSPRIEAFWQNNELYLNFMEKDSFSEASVLVEINAAKDKIAGGILLSTTVKTSRGEVVAVGEGMTAGMKRVEVNVKVPSPLSLTEVSHFLESFGMSSDEFDKETVSSDGLQPKQADLATLSG
ncbi:auxilin-like protein [Tanacetum coccineum]